ncbi:MAG: pirin family protein [Pyrinomonadaceae bacterium]|nr:pirin family protein [Pyrinomonadaceae bacterium]
MIETVIPYRTRSIGPIEVRRILPFAKRRSVGPFVFVDDFGPFEAVNDSSLDILPHPHIGLATVTYLFSGHMTHRDSIGNVQRIVPGEVNWMSAGLGIVHSERVSDAGNAEGDPIAGLQTWVALPEKHEESDPAFSHHPSSELPELELDGVSLKLILGEYFDTSSPVETLGDPFYVECMSEKGGIMELGREIEERAVYGLSGTFEIGGKACGPGELAVLKSGVDAQVSAGPKSRFMILGGPALESKRFMYWNFVSSSRERIEAAKDDWQNNRFGDIPNETGRIPLPKL